MKEVSLCIYDKYKIPVTKCLQLAVTDDITPSCIVTTDIDSNGVENVIMGSSSGTIRAVRVIPSIMSHQID